MSRDVHVSVDDVNCDVNVWVKLRYEPFAQMTALLGATTDLARADLIGAARKTIQRARKGDRVGEVLIGRTLAILQRHGDELNRFNLYPTFDALFEVVEENAPAQKVETT